MDGMGIADTVVIRHICKCKDSALHPGHDEVTEHRFDVDGEDFPWYINERGPLVTRVLDDLYVIDLGILLLDKESKKTLKFSYWPTRVEDGSSVPFVPVLGDVKFPWTCTDDEMFLRFSHKQIPTVHLRFFARDVDAKGIEVDDQREHWRERAVYRAGGDMIRDGKDACYWCGELVDDMWDHHQHRHPETISASRGYRVS